MRPPGMPTDALARTGLRSRGAPSWHARTVFYSITTFCSRMSRPRQNRTRDPRTVPAFDQWPVQLDGASDIFLGEAFSGPWG